MKWNDYILRIRDITGKPHDTSITFPQIFTKISQCDLQERETEIIEDQVYVLETRPFEIHTFCLRK